MYLVFILSVTLLSVRGEFGEWYCNTTQQKYESEEIRIILWDIKEFCVFLGGQAYVLRLFFEIGFSVSIYISIYFYLYYILS